MVRIGHASIDENGRIAGGQAGDQSGKEVFERDWYKHPWNKVIRPKRKEVAEIIAATMEAICRNPFVGYDQKERTTLFKQAKLVKFKINKIKVKCETDCSASISVCVNAAGITVSENMWTGNEAKLLLETKEFEVLTDLIYLESDKHLRRGDILLKEGSHTAVVLSDGSLSKPQTFEKAENKKNITKVAKEVIQGKYGIGIKRKQRLEADGYDYIAIQKEVNRILKK